jgi:hypothetical protein
MQMLMSDTLQQFIQIGIVGVFLTFLIEFIKARFGTDSDKQSFNHYSFHCIGCWLLLSKWYVIVATDYWNLSFGYNILRTVR